MLLPTTEILPEGPAIDMMSSLEGAGAMLNGQVRALSAVRKAVPSIVEASDVMSGAVRRNNSLIYAAAGSSGLMALADACELPGTFGIPTNLIQIHMAGGVPVNGQMPGDTEDDAAAAERVASTIQQNDAVIVLSASGTTPYAVQVARSAKEKAATVIGIANNPQTELLEIADVAICLETPAEVIAGSTRMGAGTAQKAALNFMSTLMGIKLGHVHQGQMVNLVADNAKLVKRASRIVASIADVSEAEAMDALTASDGHVKLATLVATGRTIENARSLLAKNQGHLGPCLEPSAP